MVYDPLSFSSTGGFTGNAEIHASVIAEKRAAISAAAAAYDPTAFSTTGGWDNVKYDVINPPLPNPPAPLQPSPETGGGSPDNPAKDNGTKDNGSSTSSGGGSGPSSPVKVATPDLINAFSLQKYNDVPIDSMSDIIFEDLGGQELLSVSRTDLINGQNISYQPISNLGSISIENSPGNIIKLQSTSKSYFDSFPIVLEDYIPSVGTGSNGEIVYMDSTSGENIIIGTINMTSDKLVQVEFITYGNMINDIIYP
jgi:hypothetical protein